MNKKHTDTKNNTDANESILQIPSINSIIIGLPFIIYSALFISLDFLPFFLIFIIGLGTSFSYHYIEVTQGKLPRFLFEKMLFISILLSLTISSLL